jgi:hypothetical protein
VSTSDPVLALLPLIDEQAERAATASAETRVVRRREVMVVPEVVAKDLLPATGVPAPERHP